MTLDILTKSDLETNIQEAIKSSNRNGCSSQWAVISFEDQYIKKIEYLIIKDYSFFHISNVQQENLHDGELQRMSN